MKVLKSFLFVIVFILFSCDTSNPSLNQKTNDEKTGNLTEYYSMIPLRESPYPTFQGILRLSKEEAMARNHYRFVYDSEFRLESISFWIGDKLRKPNHTANYFFTSPIQKLKYIDNKEIITYYDRFGNQTTQRGAYKSVYSLDKQQRRVALHFEDDNGITIENSWGISNYEWEHLNDGSIIESRFDLNGNIKSLRPHFEFYRIKLYYEQNGYLALMQNIDDKGFLKENNSGVAQDKLLFDNEGRWLGWNVLNAEHQLHRGNGPNVAKGINIPNKFGYETSIRYEDVDGATIINSHGFWGGKRYYDTYGNYSHTHFLDSSGNPGINQKTGYCHSFYTLDNRGYNILKIELMDVNKKPVLHKKGGYATIQYEYDEFDNKIKVNYLGLDGKKINRKDNGVSYIIYDYDENHALKNNNRYNKSGELLN